MELFVGLVGLIEGCGDGIAFGDTGAEGADPSEGIEFIEADGERVEAAHGEAGDGAVFAPGFDAVFLFDHWQDGFEQIDPKFFCIFGRECTPERLGNGMTVEHYHDHGLGFSGGDEVVENPVRFSVISPSCESITVAVLENEKGVRFV